MARLRSATKKATASPTAAGDDMVDSSFTTAGRPAPDDDDTSSRKPAARGGVKALRSRMPVPATISYPSLPGFPPQSPAKKAPARKVEDENPTASMPGAFEVPANATDFTFKFSSGLAEDKARVGNPITPPSRFITTPTTKQTATTGRRTRSRFSDAHQEQFARMESIADYAAKRTKVTTPQNPQKGIKRTQSQATLDEKILPPTPSPVKKQPDADLIAKQQLLESGRRSKRAKVDPVSSFSAKIGSLTGATPMRGTRLPPSAARTAVVRRVSNQRRPMPALPPRSAVSGIEPTIRLVPSSLGGATPSRIPSTPSSSRGLFHLAPATVAAAPKFGLSKIPGGTSTNTDLVPSPKKSMARAMDEVNARVIRQLKKPGDGTGKMSGLRTHMGVLSPIGITESVDLEDPFASEDLRRRGDREWGFQAPAGTPVMPQQFPKAPTHDPTMGGSKKRKDLDSVQASAIPVSVDSPARKKFRYEGTSAAMVDKGRSLLDKARLEFLATPKRKMEKMRGIQSSAKNSGGIKRPVWK